MENTFWTISGIGSFVFVSLQVFKYFFEEIKKVEPPKWAIQLVTIGLISIMTLFMMVANGEIVTNERFVNFLEGFAVFYATSQLIYNAFKLTKSFK